MNKVAYIFDVDGTLTEPRKRITDTFKSQFMEWAVNKDLYISTGSDFSKTSEQLDQETLNLFKKIYCCMGNETRSSNGEILDQRIFNIPAGLIETLVEELNKSEYKDHTGNHIELRTGMINFSIVGRNADHDQRQRYNSWDSNYNEREKIANTINKKFINLEASVGGSISIDIIEKGKDKGQVVKHIVDMGYNKIIFCGDKCLPGGNDYGIVRELEKQTIDFEWYNVEGPQALMDIILNEKL